MSTTYLFHHQEEQPLQTQCTAAPCPTNTPQAGLSPSGSTAIHSLAQLLMASSSLQHPGQLTDQPPEAQPTQRSKPPTPRLLMDLATTDTPVAWPIQCRTHLSAWVAAQPSRLPLSGATSATIKPSMEVSSRVLCLHMTFQSWRAMRAARSLLLRHPEERASLQAYLLGRVAESDPGYHAIECEPRLHLPLSKQAGILPDTQQVMERQHVQSVLQAIAQVAADLGQVASPDDAAICTEAVLAALASPQHRGEAYEMVPPDSPGAVNHQSQTCHTPAPPQPPATPAAGGGQLAPPPSAQPAQPAVLVDFKGHMIQLGEYARRRHAVRRRLPLLQQYATSLETAYGVAPITHTHSQLSSDHPSWRHARDTAFARHRHALLPQAHTDDRPALAKVGPDARATYGQLSHALPAVAVQHEDGLVSVALGVHQAQLPHSILHAPGLRRVLVPFSRSQQRKGHPERVTHYWQYEQLCGLGVVASLLGSHVASLTTSVLASAAVDALYETAQLARGDQHSLLRLQSLLPRTRYSSLHLDQLHEQIRAAGVSPPSDRESPTRPWRGAEVCLMLSLHNLHFTVHRPGDGQAAEANAAAYLMTDGAHWRLAIAGWQTLDDSEELQQPRLTHLLLDSQRGIRHDLGAQELCALLSTTSHIAVYATADKEPATLLGVDPPLHRISESDANACAAALEAIVEHAEVTYQPAELSAPWYPTKRNTKLPLLHVKTHSQTIPVVLMDWLHFGHAILDSPPARTTKWSSPFCPPSATHITVAPRHAPPPATAHPGTELTGSGPSDHLAVGGPGPGEPTLSVVFHNVGQLNLTSGPGELSGMLASLRPHIMAVAELGIATSGTRASLRAKLASLPGLGKWHVALPDGTADCRHRVKTDIAVWISATMPWTYNILVPPRDICTRLMAVIVHTEPKVYLVFGHLPPQPWTQNAADTPDCMRWLKRITEKAATEQAQLFTMIDENDIATYQDHMTADQTLVQMGGYTQIHQAITSLGLHDAWLLANGPTVQQDVRAATHVQSSRTQTTATRKDVVRAGVTNTPHRMRITNHPPGTRHATASDHSSLQLEYWPAGQAAQPVAANQRPSQPEQWSNIAWKRMLDAETTDHIMVSVRALTARLAERQLQRAGISPEGTAYQPAGMGAWLANIPRAANATVDWAVKVGRSKPLQWPRNSWQRMRELLTGEVPQHLPHSPAGQLQQVVRVVHQAGAACVGYTGGPRRPRRRPRCLAAAKLARRALGAFTIQQRKRVIRAISTACPTLRAYVSGTSALPSQAWNARYLALLRHATETRARQAAKTRDARVTRMVAARRNAHRTAMRAALDSYFDRADRQPTHLLQLQRCTGQQTKEYTSDPTTVVQSLHDMFANWAPPDPHEPPPVGWQLSPTDQLQHLLPLGTSQAARDSFAPDPTIDPQALADMCAPMTPHDLAIMLRSNTAPGKTAVSFRALRESPAWVHTALLAGCNEILADPSQYPEWMGAGVLIPIPKASNQTQMLHGVMDANNVRPIALQESVHKLLSGLLAHRFLMADKKHCLLPPELVGFRPGRSAHEANLLFQDLADQDNLQSKPVYELEIDIKRAFDTTRWRTVAPAMAALHAPSQYVKLRHAMMEAARVQVASFAGLTSSIKMDCLLQGDPLSVAEFNAVMAPLARRLAGQLGQVAGFAFAIFADDIKVRANDRATLQTALDIVCDHLATTGQTVSSAKTVLRCNTLGPHVGLLLPSGERTAVAQGNTATRHLGVYSTPTGDLAASNERLTATVRQLAGAVRQKAMTMPEWRTAWNMVIVPKIAYAACTTATSRAQLDALDTICWEVVTTLGGAAGTKRFTARHTSKDVVFTPSKWSPSIRAVGLGFRSIVDVVATQRATWLLTICNHPPPLLRHLSKRLVAHITEHAPTGGLEVLTRRESRPATWLNAALADLRALGATLALRELDEAQYTPQCWQGFRPGPVAEMSAEDARTCPDTAPYCLLPAPPRRPDALVAPRATLHTHQRTIMLAAAAYIRFYRHPEAPEPLRLSGNVELHTDGGCKLEAGSMSAGYVILRNDTEIQRTSAMVARYPLLHGWAPAVSSTVAELWAMVLALQEVLPSPDNHTLTIVSDSKPALELARHTSSRAAYAQSPSPRALRRSPDGAALAALQRLMHAHLQAGTQIHTRWVKAHVTPPTTRDEVLNAVADELATQALSQTSNLLGCSPRVQAHLPDILMLPSRDATYGETKTQHCRVADVFCPSLGHQRACLLAAAAAARSVRLRAGILQWTAHALPEGEPSRSTHRLAQLAGRHEDAIRDKDPRYARLTREGKLVAPRVPASPLRRLSDRRRWDAGIPREHLLLPQVPWEAGPNPTHAWRQIACALGTAAANSLAQRHAVRLLTGNWPLPDIQQWLSAARLEWSCPRQATTGSPGHCPPQPTAAHMVAHWNMIPEARWWQALVPHPNGPSMRTAAKKLQQLVAAAERTKTTL